MSAASACSAIDHDAGLGTLRELLRQPSVSADGEGVAACARLVARILERYGFAAEVLETGGHPAVLGELGAGAATLLLYAHYDVQPVGDEREWTTPPFEPTLRDDRLYARGAVDDKGHIASRLAAIAAFTATHGPPPFRIVFLIEGEEEIGSPSLPALLRRHAPRLRADGCIWESGELDLDDRPVITLGLRGMVDVELAVDVMGADAHSGEYSFLPNAAWRLVWALATLKGPDERILIDGFYDTVRAPTERQLALLADAPFDAAAARRAFGATELAGGRAGVAVRRAVFSPTCTINGLTAGHQGHGPKAILPAAGRAKLEFRLVPDQTPERVVEQLRRHLDARGFGDVALAAGAGTRPAVVNPDDPFVGLVVDAARDVYGSPVVVQPLAGGSGPLEPFISELGIPVVDGVGLAYPGCRAHAPDEHLRLEQWDLATRHMTRVLERFAQQCTDIATAGDAHA